MTTLRSPLLLFPMMMTAALAACSVTDESVGERQADKFEVCHAAGNSGQSITLSVDAEGLEDHLAHGDTPGACLTPCEASCEDLASAVAEFCYQFPLPPEELEAFCGFATQNIRDNCSAECPEPSTEECEDFCTGIADATREDCYEQDPVPGWSWLCDIGADMANQECRPAFECPPTCWEACDIGYEEGWAACDEAGGDPECYSQVQGELLNCQAGCCAADCVQYECSYCEGDEQCLAECAAQCEQWCGPSCWDGCYIEYEAATQACDQAGGDPQCYEEAEAQLQACEGSCCATDCVDWQCDYCDGDEACLAECSQLCEDSCGPWCGATCYDDRDAAWTACYEASADDPCYYGADDVFQGCQTTCCETDCATWCALDCQGDEACVAECAGMCQAQCEPYPGDECYSSCWLDQQIAVFRCEQAGGDPDTCYFQAEPARLACETGCCEAGCNADCDGQCGGDPACVEECQGGCAEQCAPPCDYLCHLETESGHSACLAGDPDPSAPCSAAGVEQACLVQWQGFNNECLYGDGGCFDPTADCWAGCDDLWNDAFVACLGEPECLPPEECYAVADEAAGDCWFTCEPGEPGDQCWEVCPPDDTECFQTCCSDDCEPEDPACLEQCCLFGCDATGADQGCYDACYVPTGPCPEPQLSVFSTGYWFDLEFPDEPTIELLFDTGIESTTMGCFTTGSELYLDSRIDLSIPGGDLVATFPDAFVQQPANLEVGPLREGGITLLFGDIFQTSELSTDLSTVLVDNPTLDGYARLCNADGICDEVTFTLGTF